MEINGKTYTLVSGYGTVVKYCKDNNREFYEFLQSLQVEEKKIPNDFFLTLAGYTQTMIQRGGGEPPDIYEIIDWLGKGNGTKIIDLIFEGLSLPKNPKTAVKGK